MRFREFGLFSLSLSLSWLLRDSFQLLLLRCLELTIGSEMCARFRQEPCRRATSCYKIFGSVEMTNIFLEGDNTLSGSSISESFDLFTSYYYLDKELILAYQRLFSKLKTVYEEKSSH